MVSPALPFALGAVGDEAPRLPFQLRGTSVPAAVPAVAAIDDTRLIARIDSLHALVEEARFELHELRIANVELLDEIRGGATILDPPAQAAEEAPAPSGTLTLKLLGDFAVRAGDRRVERWSSRKARQLVAYLAMHRERSVPRESLAELFWPGSSPGRGANNLSIAVHRVRSLLRELTSDDNRGIAVEQGTYRLDPAITWNVDAIEFAQLIARAESAVESAAPEAARTALHQAVALYRGDFMAADRYEDWTVAIRERLATGYEWALDWLAGDAAAAGDWLQSLHFAQTLVEHDALNEGAHRRMMRAHIELGNASLALRQFERCEELLRTELGVAPAPETLALARSLRGH